MCASPNSSSTISPLSSTPHEVATAGFDPTPTPASTNIVESKLECLLIFCPVSVPAEDPEPLDRRGIIIRSVPTESMLEWWRTKCAPTSEAGSDSDLSGGRGSTLVVVVGGVVVPHIDEDCPAPAAAVTRG